MTGQALCGARIVTADRVLDDHVLLIEKGRIAAIVPRAASPAPGVEQIELGGGWLLAGFIDTQVNGGGDVLLNDQPSVSGLQTMAAAHRRYGTTGMLPTLISDRVPVIDAALAAGEAALAARLPGVLGLHIEGPYLNPGKKGIHDAARFAPLDADAIARLAAPTRGRRIVTLAPEQAPDGAIRALRDAGVIVCAGHSLATYEQIRAALDDGLCGFTHLFNAMTQLSSREPGMVGAALEDKASHFGLIADGVHVHPAALRVALAAGGPSRAMLVTDAMSPVGGSARPFSLMGTRIEVADGICRGPDGTLAGSALTMAQAFRNAMDLLGCDIVSASRLASANAAAFLGLDKETGTIAPGLAADLVHLDDDRRVTRTWIAGEREDRGE